MVDQKHVDLRLRWIGPGQRVLRELDGGDTKVEENFALRAETPGEYRLEVAAAEVVEEDLGGPYTLELFELRDAKADDPARLHAWERFQVGRDAYQHGRPEQAQAFFEKALREFESLGDPLGEAMTLQQLGWLADHQRDDTREARDFYRRARTRFAETSAKLLEYDLVSDLAAAEGTLGNFDAAQALYREAQAYFEASGLEQRLAKTLTGLGLALRDSGDAAVARPILETALSMHREFVGSSSWEVATLNGLGLVESDVGSLTSALQWYEKALGLARSSGDGTGIVRSLIHMSACYRRLGEPEEALRLLEQAEDETGGTEATEWEIEARLIETWLTIGDLERARTLAEKLLAWSGGAESPEIVENPGRLGQAYFFVASIHQVMGHVTTAQRHYELALQAIGAAQMPDLESAVHLGLARCLIDRHLLSDAETMLATAHRQAVASGFVGSRINVDLERGRLFRLQRNYARSLATLQTALEETRLLALPSLEAEALAGLARLERARGRLTAAYDTIQVSLSLYESLRGRVGHQDLRAVFLARRLDSYRFAVDLLLEMHAKEPSAGYDAMALAAHERTRARTLLEMLRGARVHPERDLPSEFRRRRQAAVVRLESLQRSLTRQFEDPDSEPGYVESLQAELREVFRDMESLDLEAQRESPSLDLESFELSTVQALLDRETALLEYVLGERTSYVFVVTNTQLTLHELPKESIVNRGVAALQDHLQRPSFRMLALQESAYQLYRDLIAPLRDRIESKQHLIIVPDGDLFYLPFETLRPRPPAMALSSEGYLLDSWSVSYAPSAMSLAVLEGRKDPPADRLELVAFSYSPDRGESVEPQTGRTRALSSGRSPRLGPLPYAREEVIGIGALFPQDAVRLHLDDTASETRVKNSTDLRRARRLHFAVHGLIDERNPDLSGLYLAGEEESGEDGLLQVREIFDLDITADLVVLSACKTGLGRQIRGEGLLGLPRAFFFAGTPLLAVSLWPVDDHSTAQLMTEFYKLQRDGVPAHEALRSAKAKLLENRGSSHPYYWAPFVLFGKN